jgi:GTP1/Obg family GTP-binding protein
MTFRHSIIALFSTLLVTAAPLALAQQQAPQQAASDIEVSDAQLESFVDVQGSLSEIQQDYSGRMENVEDPKKANELRQQANAEMIEAVEESGLTVESFNQIAQAAQNDPELQQRLQRIDG